MDAKIDFGGPSVPPEVSEELALLADLLDGTSKPIIFTSPRPRAGTSTVARAVASSLAEKRGQRVVLVDCDYRKPANGPSSSRYEERGLADCVADGSRAGIRETAIAKLSYLPPGHAPESPPQFFGSEAFQRTIEGLSQSYEHVIIDAPPILSYSDVLIMCRHGYEAFLVADAVSTRAEQVIEAKARVENAKGRVAGVILNRRPYYLPGFIYRML